MKIFVSNIVRKARGGVAYRDNAVDAPAVRFGRGADCEVHLPDPRVLLKHATLEARAGGVFIDASPSAEVTVNGAAATAAKLNVGDKVGLGPYQLEVLAPPEGQEFAVSLELVRPLGDDLDELKQRSSARIDRVGFGKRGWSYGLFAVIALVFFLWPLVTFLTRPAADHASLMQGDSRGFIAASDKLWLSGEISGPHKFFGDKCEGCHQSSFVQVKDEACISCHEKVTHHVDVVKFPDASFAAESCQSCHKEHNGVREAVLRDQNFCASCHATIEKTAAAANLLNATDFGRDHPQFRPTVVTDPVAKKLERISLDSKPKEMSGLKFPHDKHLNPNGVRSPDAAKPVVMNCENCHVPESGGVLFKQVSFEANCQSCHLLQFEAQAPERRMPHGKPAEALQAIKDAYSSMALRGGYNAPTAPEVVRRRPGLQPLTAPERLEALAWADSKANETIAGHFGKGRCAECHVISEGATPTTWDVVPATVAKRWLTKGQFDHGKHRDVACESCHGARNSSSAQDVLLPGMKAMKSVDTLAAPDIKGCQDCHGGERAANKVPSTCISCHQFHVDGMPPMRKGKSASLPVGHPVNVAFTGGSARQ